jgi:hypothetical protein
MNDAAAEDGRRPVADDFWGSRGSAHGLDNQPISNSFIGLPTNVERMKSLRSRHKVSLPLTAIFLLVAGGLAQGLAQTRYSVNVVGYSDAEFAAGSNLVANPLDAGNNTLSNLFAGVPSGSFFLPWDSAGQKFGAEIRYNSETGWSDKAATLRQPAGGFLWLPSPRRISFVGEPWFPMCVTFQEGESLFGFMPQYACGFCAGVNDCLVYPPDHTIVEKWDRQGQFFRVYDFLGAEIGWYPDIVSPTLAPDEAAFFRSPIQFAAKIPGFYGPSPVQLSSPLRDGANFVFKFYSQEQVSVSVQRSTNLGSGSWRTIRTESSIPINGVITVTVPMEVNTAAFYRVESLRLRNPSRAGNEFRFQFYAEDGVRYQVSRSVSLSGGAWLPVQSIEGTGALVTATDATASIPAAYYRVEY